MNTSDRLNKIASLAENAENAKNAKEIAEQNEKQALINLIASYAERIRAIIEVGSKLVESKLPLGKQNCLQSGFINHQFGFMVEGSLILNPDAWKIIGIGRKGGGWAGNDFLVNSDGEVIEYSQIYNCESWTEKFEQFEKDFYDYVDNEI